MFSNIPKVLHQLAGQPLLGHVLQAARKLKPLNTIVIYGFGGEAVPSAFKEDDIVWIRQEQQLGTGHAVQQALPAISATGKTLILLGDVPMLNIDQCRSLLEKTAQIGLMTVKKQNPNGYGRIVRDEAGDIRAIIEHKDASHVQRSIDEVNTGIMVVENGLLKNCLARLNNQNAQGEYYLTDIIAMAVEDGYEVASEMVSDESSVEGVNSKQDLAALERVYQSRQAAALLQRGVTIRDPHRLDIRGEIEVGQDVEIDIGCVFEGKVILGDGVKIGAYCVIKDTTVGRGTAIAPFTHTDQVSIAASCKIGPYARLRPGTVLQDEAHVGNFVELKNAQVDLGSKINHLSYVGDTTVGKYVNIGAGTITCNYDGANKFRTVIEDYAFIGSDSQLVAPVTVGNGATIGAGSTITKDAPAGELTIARGRQVTVKGWKRPQKIKQ